MTHIILHMFIATKKPITLSGGFICYMSLKVSIIADFALDWFNLFHFQKENGGIVIYNLNHLVFVLKSPILQTNFNVTGNNFAGQYNKQSNTLLVGRHEALSNPEISCPPRAN
jgi:hypothetical protein